MRIKIYSKPECKKCVSAKQKLENMGLEYEEHSAEFHSEWNENWRENGSVGFKALNVYEDGQLPIIEIDGECYNYSSAMKKLKKQ